MLGTHTSREESWPEGEREREREEGRAGKGRTKAY